MTSGGAYDAKTIQNFRNSNHWSKIINSGKAVDEMWILEAKLESALRSNNLNDELKRDFEENFISSANREEMAPYKKSLDLLQAKFAYKLDNKAGGIHILQVSEPVDLLKGTPRELELYGDLLLYQASYFLHHVHKDHGGPGRKFIKKVMFANYEKACSFKFMARRMCNNMRLGHNDYMDSTEVNELLDFFNCGFPSLPPNVAMPDDEGLVSQVSYSLVGERLEKIKNKFLHGIPFKLGNSLKWGRDYWRGAITLIRGSVVEACGTEPTFLNGGASRSPEAVDDSELLEILLAMMPDPDGDLLKSVDPEFPAVFDVNTYDYSNFLE